MSKFYSIASCRNTIAKDTFGLIYAEKSQALCIVN